ncbi:MAG: selenium cofactor biosynthesis protein YqeC [Sedimentibacter sp.]|uniref:selenium cofactor biosynthesis protein YqeC n=1 Tax=Sedimentibacter sp. TaxID=1960295 RepID=UPI003159666E
MKSLTEIFEIEKGDVVSIVGTGGKTSLLFLLGKELGKHCKVLLTTSTKIYVPKAGDCDYVFTCLEDYFDAELGITKGTVVVSKGIMQKEQKLLGIDDSDADRLAGDFHVVLIESDGSRNLPLKGWKDHEPPVLEKTTKTIGIFPIDMLDAQVTHENVYGYEKFMLMTGNKDKADMETVGNICSHMEGIFKNSRGRLFFFINRADEDQKLKKAFELASYLKKNVVGNPLDFKVCLGSLKDGVFYEG